jgi:molybdopterin/thiamine biosynthesis adenylyltransferase
VKQKGRSQIKTPVLRSGLRIGWSNNELHVILPAHNIELTFEAPPEVEVVLRLLDGAHTVADIVDVVKQHNPSFSHEALSEILDVLAENNLIFDAEQLKGRTPLWERQLDFLDALSTVPGMGLTALRRLRDSRVAILGLGGLGSWAALFLAKAGVGKLKLIDPDRVEWHNLPVQALYGARDVGKFKVEAASEALQSATPWLEVETYKTRIENAEQLTEVLRGCSAVIGAADEPSVVHVADIVSAACHKLNIPYTVAGGYIGGTASLGSTFIPNQTTCWECASWNLDREPERRDGLRVFLRRPNLGAFAPLAAIVASVQVWDLLRVLTQIGWPLLANRFGEISLQDLTIRWRPYAPRIHCERCGGLKQPEHTSNPPTEVAHVHNQLD